MLLMIAACAIIACFLFAPVNAAPRPPQKIKCPDERIFVYENHTLADRERYLHIRIKTKSLEECVRECFGSHFCFSVKYDESQPESCALYYFSAYNCTRHKLVLVNTVQYKGSTVTVDCLRCPSLGQFGTVTIQPDSTGVSSQEVQEAGKDAAGITKGYAPQESKEETSTKPAVIGEGSSSAGEEQSSTTLAAETTLGSIESETTSAYHEEEKSTTETRPCMEDTGCAAPWASKNSESLGGLTLPIGEGKGETTVPSEQPERPITGSPAGATPTNEVSSIEQSAVTTSAVPEATTHAEARTAAAEDGETGDKFSFGEKESSSEGSLCQKEIFFIGKEIASSTGEVKLGEAVKAESVAECAKYCLELSCDLALYTEEADTCELTRNTASMSSRKCEQFPFSSYVSHFKGRKVEITCVTCGLGSKNILQIDLKGSTGAPTDETTKTIAESTAWPESTTLPSLAIEGSTNVMSQVTEEETFNETPAGSKATANIVTAESIEAKETRVISENVTEKPFSVQEDEKKITSNQKAAASNEAKGRSEKKGESTSEGYSSGFGRHSCVATFEVNPNGDIAGFQADEYAHTESADKCALICYRDSCTSAVFIPPTEPGEKGLCKMRFAGVESCNGHLGRDYYVKPTKAVFLQCFRCFPERPVTEPPVENEEEESPGKTERKKTTQSPVIKEESRFTAAEVKEETTKQSVEKFTKETATLGTHSEEGLQSVAGQQPATAQSTDSGTATTESKESGIAKEEKQTAAVTSSQEHPGTNASKTETTEEKSVEPVSVAEASTEKSFAVTAKSEETSPPSENECTTTPCGNQEATAAGISTESLTSEGRTGETARKPEEIVSQKVSNEQSTLAESSDSGFTTAKYEENAPKGGEGAAVGVTVSKVEEAGVSQGEKDSVYRAEQTSPEVTVGSQSTFEPGKSLVTAGTEQTTIAPASEQESSASGSSLEGLPSEGEAAKAAVSESEKAVSSIQPPAAESFEGGLTTARADESTPKEREGAAAVNTQQGPSSSEAVGGSTVYKEKTTIPSLEEEGRASSVSEAELTSPEVIVSRLPIAEGERTTVAVGADQATTTTRFELEPTAAESFTKSVPSESNAQVTSEPKGVVSQEIPSEQPEIAESSDSGFTTAQPEESISKEQKEAAVEGAQEKPLSSEAAGESTALEVTTAPSLGEGGGISSQSEIPPTFSEITVSKPSMAEREDTTIAVGTEHETVGTGIRQESTTSGSNIKGLASESESVQAVTTGSKEAVSQEISGEQPTTAAGSFDSELTTVKPEEGSSKEAATQQEPSYIEKAGENTATPSTSHSEDQRMLSTLETKFFTAETFAKELPGAKVEGTAASAGEEQVSMGPERGSTIEKSTTEAIASEDKVTAATVSSGEERRPSSDLSKAESGVSEVSSVGFGETTVTVGEVGIESKTTKSVGSEAETIKSTSTQPEKGSLPSSISEQPVMSESVDSEATTIRSEGSEGSKGVVIESTTETSLEGLSVTTGTLENSEKPTAIENITPVSAAESTGAQVVKGEENAEHGKVEHTEGKFTSSESNVESSVQGSTTEIVTHAAGTEVEPSTLASITEKITVTSKGVESSAAESPSASEKYTTISTFEVKAENEATTIKSAEGASGSPEIEGSGEDITAKPVSHEGIATLEAKGPTATENPLESEGTTRGWRLVTTGKEVTVETGESVTTGGQTETGTTVGTRKEAITVPTAKSIDQPTETEQEEFQIEYMQGCIVSFQVDPVDQFPAEVATDIEGPTIARTAEVCAARCYQDGCTGAKYNPETKECFLGYGGKQSCNNGLSHFFYTANETIWIHCTTCKLNKPEETGVNIVVALPKSKGEVGTLSAEPFRPTTTTTAATTITTSEIISASSKKTTALSPGENEGAATPTYAPEEETTKSSIGEHSVQPPQSTKLIHGTVPEVTTEAEGPTTEMLEEANKYLTAGHGCIVSFQAEAISKRPAEFTSPFEKTKNADAAEICAHNCYQDGCTGAKYDPSTKECALSYGDHQYCTAAPYYQVYKANETTWIHCTSCRQKLPNESIFKLLTEIPQGEKVASSKATEEGATVTESLSTQTEQTAESGNILVEKETTVSGKTAASEAGSGLVESTTFKASTAETERGTFVSGYQEEHEAVTKSTEMKASTPTFAESPKIWEGGSETVGEEHMRSTAASGHGEERQGGTELAEVIGSTSSPAEGSKAWEGGSGTINEERITTIGSLETEKDVFKSTTLPPAEEFTAKSASGVETTMGKGGTSEEETTSGVAEKETTAKSGSSPMLSSIDEYSLHSEKSESITGTKNFEEGKEPTAGIIESASSSPHPEVASPALEKSEKISESTAAVTNGEETTTVNSELYSSIGSLSALGSGNSRQPSLSGVTFEDETMKITATASTSAINKELQASFNVDETKGWSKAATVIDGGKVAVDISMFSVTTSTEFSTSVGRQGIEPQTDNNEESSSKSSLKSTGISGADGLPSTVEVAPESTSRLPVEEVSPRQFTTEEPSTASSREKSVSSAAVLETGESTVSVESTGERVRSESPSVVSTMGKMEEILPTTRSDYSEPISASSPEGTAFITEAPREKTEEITQLGNQTPSTDQKSFPVVVMSSETPESSTLTRDLVSTTLSIQESASEEIMKTSVKAEGEVTSGGEKGVTEGLPVWKSNAGESAEAITGSSASSPEFQTTSPSEATASSTVTAAVGDVETSTGGVVVKKVSEEPRVEGTTGSSRPLESYEGQTTVTRTETTETEANVEVIISSTARSDVSEGSNQRLSTVAAEGFDKESYTPATGTASKYVKTEETTISNAADKGSATSAEVSEVSKKVNLATEVLPHSGISEGGKSASETAAGPVNSQSESSTVTVIKSAAVEATGTLPEERLQGSNLPKGETMLTYGSETPRRPEESEQSGKEFATDEGSVAFLTETTIKTNYGTGIEASETATKMPEGAKESDVGPTTLQAELGTETLNTDIPYKTPGLSFATVIASSTEAPAEGGIDETSSVAKENFSAARASELVATERGATSEPKEFTELTPEATEPPVKAVSDLVVVLSHNTKLEEVLGISSTTPVPTKLNIEGAPSDCTGGNVFFVGSAVDHVDVHFDADASAASVQHCARMCYELRCSLSAFTRFPRPTCLMQFNESQLSSCSAEVISEAVDDWQLKDDWEIVLMKCFRCGAFT